MLTLVAMGKGVLPVGDHSRSYYPRPDVAHVPLRDAQPIERGPVWLVPGAWDPFARAEKAWRTGGDAPPSKTRRFPSKWPARSASFHSNSSTLQRRKP
ncbi:hypothetical protein ACFU98_46355 [Streptomyces sp. NPDC057575]|uniref:hypothetical protein n=1 Tax=unclassified Streptomyces TaxID=2593676 RepID=UPI0036A28C8D